MELYSTVATDLHFQKPVLITLDVILVYLVLGPIVIALNAPLTIYLITTVTREKKELFMMIILSMCDIALATEGIASVSYTFFALDHESHNVLRMECALRPVTMMVTFSIQLDNMFMFVVALDRFFAVLSPLKYAGMGFRYTATLICMPFLGSLIGCIMNIISIHFEPPTLFDHLCPLYNTMRNEFRLYLAGERIFCVAVGSIIYAYIYFSMRKKKQTVRRSSKDSGMKNLTITIGMSTTASCFLILIPDIVYHFQPFGFQISHVLYFAFFLLKMIANFFIYTLRHRELIKHLSKFLPSKFDKNRLFSHSTVSLQVIATAV